MVGPNQEGQGQAGAPEPLSEQDLLRYLDGILDAEQGKRLEERLKKDPVSRRTLDALNEEARLLREALEPLSEPATRISEKVMTVLYKEERLRTAQIKARAFRRRLFAGISVAAMLVITVAIMQPSDPAGKMASGTGITVARKDLKGPQLLGMDGGAFEGDSLMAGQGQFARMQWSGGLRTDVDESSTLRMEKLEPMTMALDCGQARFYTGAKRLVVNTPRGKVFAEPNTSFEISLPTTLTSSWIKLAQPWSPAKNEDAKPAPDVAAITVLDGSLKVAPTGKDAGEIYGRNTRILMSANETVSRTVEALNALDSRREAWAEFSGQGPKDRATLGLLPPFKWSELGRAWGLLEVKEPETARKAFTHLADAEAVKGANLLAERAASLSDGQQALRELAQSLPLGDNRRWLERTLEGLAQFERGRTLMGLNDSAARPEARTAFLAAAMAFSEALEGGDGYDPASNYAPPLKARGEMKFDAASKMEKLDRQDQAALMARFYLPWSLLMLRQTGTADDGNADEGKLAKYDLATYFESAGKAAGWSAEALSAQYGLALALEQAGRDKDAIITFQELASASVSGLSNEPRADVQALRRSAHVELARLYARNGEIEKLRLAGEAFQLRFPLAIGSAEDRAIQAFLPSALRKAAKDALNEGRHEQAARIYTDLYAHDEAVRSLTERERYQLKIEQLQANVGMNDARRALSVAKELEAMSAPDKDFMDRAKVLIEKAKALKVE